MIETASYLSLMWALASTASQVPEAGGEEDVSVVRRIRRERHEAPADASRGVGFDVDSPNVRPGREGQPWRERQRSAFLGGFREEPTMLEEGFGNLGASLLCRFRRLVDCVRIRYFWLQVGVKESHVGMRVSQFLKILQAELRVFEEACSQIELTQKEGREFDETV